MEPGQEPSSSGEGAADEEQVSAAMAPATAADSARASSDPAPAAPGVELSQEARGFLEPLPYFQAALLPVSEAWPLRRLYAGRSPGTFYTVEVLAPEGEKRSSTSSSVDPRSSSFGRIEAHRVNTEVFVARCQGRPVPELSLIPLDAGELKDAAHLAEAGIGRVVGSSPGWAAALPISPPTSLPDRDSPEEYAAWCSELEQRCRAAAVRAGPMSQAFSQRAG